MSANRYLTADEAVAVLNISKSTLYSYVSRGLIRSEETAGKSRARRYLSEDIEALRRRKEMRRNPARAAETAMHFGAPVLESAITLIDDNSLYYRGRDVCELVRAHSFEEVASLLWTGELTSTPFQAAVEDTESASALRIRALRAALSERHPPLKPLEMFRIVLPAVETDDLAAYNLAPSAVARTGARILHHMVQIVTACAAPGPIAARLAHAWAPDDPHAARLLDAALILCADHELNVSAFTARCVASSGSNPYAAVTAGLSALQGVRHGGATESVDALLHEAATDPAAAIVNRLKRGERIPGFGHPLYPNGDPRARLLIERVRRAYPESAEFQLAAEIAAETQRHIQMQPNIDFALVTLARSAALPPGAALTLFALGRTAGWIGHAIEQYASDQIIRPRARYVGEQPPARQDG